MGYRSDVRIVTSKKGYDILKKYVNDYLKNNGDQELNLLNKCYINKKTDNECYFGWNYINWNENRHFSVDSIVNGLQYLKENNYSYRYARIGEDCTDYEEDAFDSELEDEPDLEYPVLIREFDDNYVTNIMEKCNKESNAEIT